MSKLTTAIKRIIGPSIAGSGGGSRWYWLTDASGEYLRGQNYLTKPLTDLRAAYQCWKLIRTNTYKTLSGETTHTTVDYIFVVTDKKGNFIGSCQIPEKVYEGAIVIVHYSDRFDTVEELHDYNKAMDGMVSYERI